MEVIYSVLWVLSWVDGY